MRKFIFNIYLYIKILLHVKNPLLVLKNEFGLLKSEFSILEFKSGLKFKVRSNESGLKDIILIFLDSKYILKYLSKIPAGKTVLDLGAHYGSFSIFCNKNKGELKYIAVEPAKKNYELLLENIAINGMEDSITTVNMAVGDFDGKGVFSTEGSSDANKLLKSPDGSTNPEEVDVARVHTILAKELEASDLGMIKMDIEGGEYDVLPSMRDIFAKIPILILEFHPDEKIETFHQSKERLERLFAENGRKTTWSNHFTIVSEKL